MRALVNGLNMHYQVSGPQGAPIVMMSHSLGSSGSMWDSQVEALRSNFRVIRYDTRGHGGSDTPTGPYTLEALASDAVALLDHLNIEAVHWVGLSMGGMIGQVLGPDT